MSSGRPATRPKAAAVPPIDWKAMSEEPSA